MRFCPFCVSPIQHDDLECPFCGKDLNVELPSHHLKPGTILDNKIYVGAALGEGGFGITYIGRDLNLDIKVAVKEYYPNGYANRSNTISPNLTSSISSEKQELFYKGRERFLQEARTLAKFAKEPGIVEVRSFFEENNTAYIVMEFLEGKDLKEFLKEKGTLTPEHTLRLLMPVIQALKKIHEQGLIHRDISPDNIRITDDGVKLLDFGAARNVSSIANKSLSVMLKPGYAPEEQYRSKGVQGPWTDIYALCATIYKCITGITPDDSTQRSFYDELKAPSALGIKIDPVIEAALLKGLNVFQVDRYQNIEDFLNGLRGISKNEDDDRKTIYGGNAVVEDDIATEYHEISSDNVKSSVPSCDLIHHKTEMNEKAEPVETDDKQNTDNFHKNQLKKNIKKIVLCGIAFVVLVIGVILLLHSCPKQKTATPNSTTSSEETSSSPSDQNTGVPQTDWSTWQDNLPDYVTDENYEIEEQMLYRSRTQETTSSTTQSTMDGWELYHTANGSGDYGSWTSWSTQKVTASETREVETQKQYRYRTKETTTSSAATKSGWELYNTTYTWGSYGNWSNWSTSAVSASDSRQIETKIQYSYRDKETTTSSNSSLSGWTLYDTTYGAWGNAQTTTTKPTESDTLRITATTQTGWGYYHYCNYYYNGGSNWNVDSIQHGNPSYWHGYTSSIALPAVSFSDQGGQQAYGGTGSGAHHCDYNFYIWFRNPGADTYTYTYETRTKTNHFYKWSDKWSSWSDTAVSGSANRDVKTQTLYRYRDREQIPTYHFWRWGTWSSWSAEAISETNDRAVETATHYRYRDKVTETTYYFRKWSDWSEYSEVVVTPAETTEVETKTQYRFKLKN